jgi:aspartyl-tRNA(Asn)/glutamyl-tRNA(Gln) amidotransferase subunit B
VADRVPEVTKTLPELPDAKRERFISQYGMTEMHAKALTSDIRVSEFFEEVVKEVDPKTSASWVADVLKGELNYRELTVDAFKIEDMISIIHMVTQDKITEKSAVEVIRQILDYGGKPDEIVRENGLLKVEEDVVSNAVTETIQENEQAVNDYFAGKEKSLNYLVGQVMKKTRGRADAKEVRELLVDELSN